MTNVVFFVNDISTRGGTERVTSIIANALESEHCNISILGIQGSVLEFYYPLSNRIALHSLKVKNTSTWNKFYQTAKGIRKFNAANSTDIFISVESMMSIFSVPALAGTSIRHLVWEHFNFKANLGLKSRDYARQLALTFANEIITLTAKDANYWQKGAWFKRANITNIPNPVYIDHEIADIPNSQKFVIAVGRLTFQKGFDILLQSWAEVKKSGDSQWILQIIGDGKDRALLQQKIKEYKLNESVQLIPGTKDVHKYFQKASIYCLSSRFEGFPMVLLEALHFGLPIVAFNCDTGPEEVVEDNVNGLLIPPEDFRGLSLALLQLMEDPDRRKQMRRAALLKKVNFQIERIIPKWAKLINKYHDI